MAELPMSLLFTVFVTCPLLLSFFPLKGSWWVGAGFRLTSHCSYLRFFNPLSDDLMGSPPPLVPSPCCRDTVTNPPALSEPLLPAAVGLPPRHLLSVRPEL